MNKYLLDPCVEEELRYIWNYIAQDNPQAATAVVEAAFETFRRLVETRRTSGRRGNSGTQDCAVSDPSL